MTDRRQFLAGSAASTALLTSFTAHASPLLRESAVENMAGFVYDERSQHGSAMARYFDQHATRSYPMSDNLAEIWYDHLAPALQKDRRPVGGMTNAGGLFVLARLGHDAGLVLTLHGTHRFTGAGQPIQHKLDGPEFITRRFNAALTGGLPWTAALQTALIEAASRPQVESYASANMGRVDKVGQTTMHSWLMMPRG